MSVRISAVVPLFHPEPGLTARIDSWREGVRTLHLVDNTPGGSPRLPDDPGVVLHRPGRNVGVARAFNLAAEHAERDGHPWLLTMDQDSRALPGMLAELARVAEQSSPRTALVAPRLRGARRAGSDARDVRFAMSSGSLVRVESWRSVGGFDEGLFIDGVDHDFCMRLRAAGFGLLRAENARLAHAPGNRPRRLPLGWTVSHHSPTRRYYITRNRFAIARRHGVPLAACWAHLALDVMSIAAFETDARAKLRMMLRGVRDFRRGRTGALADA